ncbi:MAG: hypothetical protein COA94_06315 [Rickettsiales bacterium]|nr:MAG: hypothetical protein COA94_06315 [Rickettsiales bacterium]
MTVTLFDSLIIVITVISSLFGVYKGMIHIIINFLGFIASIVFAMVIYPYALIMLSGYIESELVASITSGVASYVFSLVIFTFITAKTILLFSDSGGGIIDRILGLVAGFARGVFFSLIVFGIAAIATTGTYSNVKHTEDMVLKLSSSKYPDWLADATTTPHLEKMLKDITSMILDRNRDRGNIEDIEDMDDMMDLAEEKEEDLIDVIKRKKKKSFSSAISKSTTSSIAVPIEVGSENDFD